MARLNLAALAALTLTMAATAPCAQAQRLIREEHVRMHVHEQVTVGSGGYNPQPYYRGPPAVYRGAYRGGSYGGSGLIGLQLSVFGVGVDFQLGNGWSRAYQVPQGYWRARGIQQQRSFDCGINLSNRRLEDAALLESGGHPDHNPNLARHLQDQISQCEPGYRNIVFNRLP